MWETAGASPRTPGYLGKEKGQTVFGGEWPALTARGFARARAEAMQGP